MAEALPRGWRRAHLLGTAGDGARRVGHAGEAIAWFEAALADDPRPGRAVALSLALLDAGRTEEGRKRLEQALVEARGATRHQLSLRMVLERLHALDVATNLTDGPDRVPDEVDLALLSVDLDGAAPWLETRVPPDHLRNAAAKLDRPYQELEERMAELAKLSGLRTPEREAAPDA